MPDLNPKFEESDVLGTTDGFSGTVGTTAISIPTAAGAPIAGFLIECRSVLDGQAFAARLLVSFDGGTTFPWTITPGNNISGNIRNRPTQMKIKGNQAGVLYQAVLELEDA